MDGTLNLRQKLQKNIVILLQLMEHLCHSFLNLLRKNGVEDISYFREEL